MKFDFEKISEIFMKLDIKFRYAIFIGILVLILLVDFFTIISLQWYSIGKMDTEYQDLKKNIEQLQVESQRISQMKEGLEKVRKELESMNRKIRQVGEVPSIVEDISSLANKAGVKIDQIKPQPEGRQNLVSSKTMKYYGLPIVVQATSNYHFFGRFLNSLERGDLFFTVNNLSIEAHGTDLEHHIIKLNLMVILSEKVDG